MCLKIEQIKVLKANVTLTTSFAKVLTFKNNQNNDNND